MYKLRINVVRRVCQIFHTRIVRENREQKMFPNEVIPQMFSNIKSIYQFHNDFLLPKLEERISNWWVLMVHADLCAKC